MHTQWPSTLWLVRHGQSAGNVARDAAEAQGLPMIDLTSRSIDTPLSPLGVQQSEALGQWFAGLPEGTGPEIVLTSPYARAHRTAELIAQQAGLSGVRLRLDERLREKEFGILDRYTRRGIEQTFPELAEQRALVGKFYFRPPGGESWCDVILRLRSALEMITREYGGRRVLVVGHQVIVNCMRYLLEQMDERQILDIDARGDLPNCGVTSYRAPAGGAPDQPMQVDLVNFTAPLIEAQTPVTSEPDASTGAKP